jgi:tripartite-type tricarboxylate transporter receptor subunit TctC
MRTQTMRLAACAIAALLVTTGARAADYPERGRPITLIVPYDPGGATDTGARLMAAGMEPILHTSVQVVNRAGAGSQVGLTQLVRSKPDGYTLSYVVVPTVITHYLDPSRHAIYTRKDFQPIGRHFESPAMLAVRADEPYKTLKDLVEAARAQPGRITVSDSGLMGVPNFETLMLGHVAGVTFMPVHFNGGAPSVTALLGGHVDVLAGGTVDAIAYTRTGQFRVLGVAGEQRDWSMPDIPTMREQGYDVLAVSNTGMIAPAGTPANVVAVLSDAMKQVIASPDHQKKLRDIALTPAYLGPEDYGKLWADTETRVEPILADLHKTK